MVGNEMRVELKNDTVLQGMLDEVNSNMDLTMFGVRCMRPGAEHAEDMEVMFVSGRMIKYVHIPDHIDIAASMRHHVSSVRGQPQPQPQPPPQQLLRGVRGAGQLWQGTWCSVAESAVQVCRA